MSKGWRIAIVVGAAIVVLAAAGIVLIPRILSSGDAPKQAAEDYLGAVAADDHDAAYALLCDRLRKAVTPERYREQVGGLNSAQPIVAYDAFFGLANPISRDAKVNVDVATVARHYNKIATMKKEDGDWRWCGVTGANQLGPSHLDPRQ